MLATWKADVTLHSLRRSRSAISLVCNGVSTMDRTRWEAEISKFCRTKFTDEAFDEKEADLLIDILDGLSKQHGAAPPDWLIGETMAARAKLNRVVQRHLLA